MVRRIAHSIAFLVAMSFCSSAAVAQDAPKEKPQVEKPADVKTGSDAATPDPDSAEQASEEDAPVEEPAEQAPEATSKTEPSEAEAPTVVAELETTERTSVSTRDLVEENERRSSTSRTAMLVLGGWSLANIGWATAGLLTTQENPGRSFHLTNAAWNLVNGTIAVIGYFSNANQDWGDHDLLLTLEKDHAAEKAFLFNAGLDVGYIFAGAWLAARGTDQQKDGLIGMGRSVMLQGAFLLAFDATVFTIHWLRRKSFQEKVRGTE